MSFNNSKTPTKPTGKARFPVPMKPHPTAGVMEYVMEGETREQFIKLFPLHSNRRIMKWFGLSFSTVQRFKRELGLEKDMKKIRRELASDVKKICEKNGYYDSLRGHPPSEACQEASRKKRAESMHPLLQVKKNNPRRYRRMMNKRSEQRRELWRKEAMREKYGLTRRTKLRVKTAPTTHRASSQKYCMIHSCNYFADPDHTDWVCYDKETRRSAKREATAEKYGLRIVAGEE